MTAGRHNITIEQGATFDVTATWYTDSTKATAVDLTGYTAAMKVRDREGTELLDLTSSGGDITLGGAAGTIQIVITAAATAALTPQSNARYDLELTTGSTVTRLLQGNVTIDAEQTKA